MSSTTTKSEQTDAPASSMPNRFPIQLKYIPLPVPPTLDNSVLVTVTEGDRSPCRRCLLDAKPGEVLHLISYDPFPTDSVTPYRGTMAIYVHANDCEEFSGDTLPESQLKRLMSLRSFNEYHMMQAADAAQGDDFEKVAGGMLADGKAEYVNVHNAKPGCFAVRVERA